ncbi:DUF4139 domain-containing protein [Fluviicola taffensis]|uniref:Mucoidy inhibitor MuiA family protein n=1 Tax=Fluviicola taffensis (strain DSM 16823 / NCIMB 13979 / RW262) TaxID=755732 RepID=F2I9M9_FLUTR|nr:DUF4139 domain-containing protein [Fluviicola taffensis]AEA42022.1 Conserved hypothetical protein CHP02231 [Fluviicola taffensis DSM 16823]
MKKVVILLLAILPSFLSLAANDKEIIKSSISEVTVYTNGAQVYRKANFNVKPGITELIIEGVSPNIDPKSLQVKAFGNVVLIDSKYQVYYPEPEKPKLEGLPLKIRKDINVLQDSINNVLFDLKEIQDEIDVLNTSKTILSNNGAIRGQGKVNDSIQLLKQAMEYYQLKMNEINKKLQVLNKRLKAKNSTVQEMNTRMSDLQNYQSSNTPKIPTGPIHRIIVTLQSKEVVAGKLNISYLASGASWIPSYDIRSEITSGKVNLAYKASIQQNTGELWDDVQLTLSTNDPYQNKIKPDLHPWYVDYYNFGAINGRMNSYSISPSPSVAYEKKMTADSGIVLEESETAANFTTVINRVLSAEYKIDLPYSIESDGESHLVLVRNLDLTANYRYYTVPKIDPGVFLVAEVLKLEDLQLVPATANIFFDGTYIGETYIDPTAMNDTLKLSLGKDPNIIAKRILLKKEYKEKVIGNDIERTYAYEISVKNLKANTIELVIEDQIPVTSNGEIVIEAINTDKANYDKTTGKLVWTLNLKTKAADKMTYSFKIKYPKDRNVILQ